MADINITELEQKVGNKYKLVVAVAKRAEQLRDGARPLSAARNRNPITIALTELTEKSVHVDPKDGTVHFRRAGAGLPDIFAPTAEASAEMDELDDLDLDGVADLDIEDDEDSE